MIQRLICAVALLFLIACDKPAEQPSETTGATANQPSIESADKPSDKAEPPKADGPVEVAAAGTKFDPPVKKDQIPEGAWFCDMGTVHYAQMDQGEKCPTCGMKLVVKKGAHKPEGDGHDHDGHDHDGHEHGEDGHDHEH